MVSIKGIFKSEDLAMALGAATSGFVMSQIPFDFGSMLGGISGVGEMAVGLGAQKFLFKKGFLKNYFRGIWLVGLSKAIAGFVPQFGGTFPSSAPGINYANGVGHPATRRPTHSHGTWMEPTVAPAGTTHLARRCVPVNLSQV